MVDEVLVSADTELNVEGLQCPEPVMMLHGKIRLMKVGEVLKVSATDTTTQKDIPKFCHFLGHVLLHQQVVRTVFDQETRYCYWIQKKSP